MGDSFLVCVLIDAKLSDVGPSLLNTLFSKSDYKANQGLYSRFQKKMYPLDGPWPTCKIRGSYQDPELHARNSIDSMIVWSISNPFLLAISFPGLFCHVPAGIWLMIGVRARD